jgi:hypothetical protein
MGVLSAVLHDDKSFVPNTDWAEIFIGTMIRMSATLLMYGEKIYLSNKFTMIDATCSLIRMAMKSSFFNVCSPIITNEDG